jgi:hypothetical protein
MVFISAQIRRREFGRKVPAEDLPVITRSARAALGVPIAARGLPPHTRLIKAYATSKRGPKRIVRCGLADASFQRPDKDQPLIRLRELTAGQVRRG